MDRPRSLIERDAYVHRYGGALLGAVIVLSLVALGVLGGVAIHELRYASDHPYAYGPAKVIALAAGAGAALAVAVLLPAVGLLRRLR